MGQELLPDTLDDEMADRPQAWELDIQALRRYRGTLSARLPGSNTPDRKRYCEALVRCLKRAERRINSKWAGGLWKHKDVAPYCEALQTLRWLRSALQAEIDGKPWQAIPYKPR